MSTMKDDLKDLASEAFKLGAARGILSERERVVKLLESMLDEDITNDSMHYQNLGIQIAIAAVKAEKIEIVQGHIKREGENK